MKKIMMFLSNKVSYNSERTKRKNIRASVLVAIMIITASMLVTVGMIKMGDAKDDMDIEIVEAINEEQSFADNGLVTEMALSIMEVPVERMVQEIKSRYMVDNAELVSIEVGTEEISLLTHSNQVLIEATPILHTEKDYTSMLKIVEAEATNEDMTGKIMVANVVLNRVDSSGFPDSIYDVIHEESGGVYQFSPIKDGRYESVTITDSTREAVTRAFNGEDFSNGALFFVARSLASDNAVSWFDNHLRKVAEHGVHDFFAY
jgi:spore germination cell wall hydrolase CwlJ-like protein